MKRRTAQLFFKSACGEEVYLREGGSMKIAMEEHKKNCYKCSPPPSPPTLTRQTAIMIDENIIIQEQQQTLF